MQCVGELLLLLWPVQLLLRMFPPSSAEDHDRCGHTWVLVFLTTLLALSIARPLRAVDVVELPVHVACASAQCPPAGETVRLALIPAAHGATSKEPHPGRAAGSTVRAPGSGKVTADPNPLELRVPIPGQRTAGLPADSVWRLRVEDTNLWAAERVIFVQPGENVYLQLFPTGEVSGRLEVPRGHDSAGKLDLAFAPSPGETAPEGSTSCIVEPLEVEAERPPSPTAERQALFRCHPPSGNLDLQFHRRGYASTHRWGVEVRPGERKALGLLTLVPGASLLGRVEWEPVLSGGGDSRRQRPLKAHEVRVFLAPLTSKPRDPAQSGRLARTGRATQPDERGFFQLTGLAAGTYVLEAQAPGRAPVRRYPVTLFRERETRLDQPLLLLPPLTLEVRVDPPRHPLKLPWKIVASPLDDPSGNRPSGRSDETNEHGIWSTDDIPPGRYGLQVQGPRDEVWWRGERTLRAGSEPVEVKLPLVEIRGRISFNDDPVRARLTFGGLEGEASIPWFASPEGLFTGWLPRPGEWPVSVLLQPGGSEQALPPVEVPAASDGSPAWLEIEVPYTYVEGQVENPQGEPLEGVRVHTRSLQEPFGLSRAVSDEDGSFRFWGLSPGPHSVYAADGSWSSPEELVEIVEGDASEPIRLVLEPLKAAEARVVGPSGPVPGTVVHYRPRRAGASVTGFRQALTDIAGQVELQVPPSTKGLDLLILPPGHAARLTSLQWRPGEPLDLQVDDLGGRLVLSVQGDRFPFGRLTLQRIGLQAAEKSSHGAGLPLLWQWTALHHRPTSKTGPWILPAMEMGEYRFCAGDSVCTSGFLAPGGELTLHLKEDPTRSSDHRP